MNIHEHQAKKILKKYGAKVPEGIFAFKVDDLIEKPEPSEAPSLLGIQGRYVFTPDLFTFLNRTEKGTGGEIQLTDAMQALAKSQNLFSWTFEGKRYDIGTMKDWFQSHFELSATSEFASILDEVSKKL